MACTSLPGASIGTPRIFAASARDKGCIVIPPRSSVSSDKMRSTWHDLVDCHRTHERPLAKETRGVMRPAFKRMGLITTGLRVVCPEGESTVGPVLHADINRVILS